MIPLRGALWTIGAIAAAFLLWWGYGRYESWQDGRQREWQHAADSVARVSREAQAKADSANFQYTRFDTTYLRGRAILLNPGPGKPPASPEVRACFALADSSRSLCDRRHDADTAALHATQRELTVWQNKPSPPAARRIQAYGEAMYDFTHMSPVARIGATARLLGPVSISGAADLAMPPAGDARVTARLLLGARINF